MSKGKVTMRDIAAELGITAAAVSMALRQDPRISAATRERVRAVAERLGYRPDPLVSVLMAQRRGKGGALGQRGTLGLVSLWPDPRSAWQSDPFYLPYREGVSERAASLGLNASFLKGSFCIAISLY